MTRPADRLLSIADVAALAGRSPRTIRRWIRCGHLQATRLGPAIWIREVHLLQALGIADESAAAPVAVTENNNP